MDLDDVPSTNSAFSSRLILIDRANCHYYAMSGSTSSSVLPGDGISQKFLDDTQHTQDVDEAIFLGLQVAGGQVLLPILLFTVLLSSKVKRHPVFLSFCVSWICSSIAFSLLLYKGRSSDDDLSLDPSYNGCLIQAALINGVQAWTVCTTLVVVLHFWIALRAIINDNIANTERHGRTWSYYCLMIGGPFFAFLAFTISSAIIGNQFAFDQTLGMALPDTNLSVPGVFYCIIILNENFTVSIRPGTKLFDAVYYFQAAVAVITTLVEGDLVRLLIVHRKASKLSKKTQMTIFLRVALFSAYRTLVLSFSILLVANPDEILIVGLASSFLYNGIANYLQAALPLVAFLVFSTERDILNEWFFWRYFGKKEKVLQEARDNASKAQTEYV